MNSNTSPEEPTRVLANVGLEGELTAFLAGFAAGFAISSEGYNNEYPFTDKAKAATEQEEWQRKRLAAAIEYINSVRST